MELHERIKQFRISQRSTISDIAEIVGISINAYSKIERGLTELNIKRLEQIAEIFNISLGELLGIEAKKDDSEENKSLKDRIIELEKRNGDLERLNEFYKNKEYENRYFFSRWFVMFMDYTQNYLTYDFERLKFLATDGEVKKLYSKIYENNVRNSTLDLDSDQEFIRIILEHIFTNGYVDKRFKILQNQRVNEKREKVNLELLRKQSE